jgi:hypothetical protein
MYDLRKVVAFFPGASADQNFCGHTNSELDEWEDNEPEIVEKGAAEPDMTALAMPEEISPYARLTPVSMNGTVWVLLADVETAISLHAKEISKIFSAGIKNAYRMHHMIAFAVSTSFSQMNLDLPFGHRCNNFGECFKGKCKCRSYVTYIPEIVAKRIVDEYLGFEEAPEEPMPSPPRTRNISYEAITQLDNFSLKNLSHLL